MFPTGQVYTGVWVSGWESRNCAGRAHALLEIGGKDHYMEAERQEQGLGLEGQERRMQTQRMAQSTVPWAWGWSRDSRKEVTSLMN